MFDLSRMNEHLCFGIAKNEFIAPTRAGFLQDNYVTEKVFVKQVVPQIEETVFRKVFSWYSLLH